MVTAYLRYAEGSTFDADTGQLLHLGRVVVVPTPLWLGQRPDELYESLRHPPLASARAHLDTMLGWFVGGGAEVHAETVRERIRELDEDPFYVAPDRRLRRPAHPPSTNTRWSFGPPLEDLLRDTVAQAQAEWRAMRARGETAPWHNRLCPLYAYAVHDLARHTGARFTAADAVPALRRAAAQLSAPDGPPHGRPPDVGAVAAFIGALIDDEVAHADGRGGFLIVAENLPF